MGDTPNKIIEKIEEYILEQQEAETSLVIALTESGIFTLPDDDSIHFDHNNDEVKESTGWIDKNIDGKTDADELIKIECSGIESINLNYKKNGVIDENGNQFLLTSDVIWNDGHHTEISDIVFNTHVSSQQNNTLPNNGDLWL